MFGQVFIISPITLRVEFLASLSAVGLKWLIMIYNGYKNIAERQMLCFRTLFPNRKKYSKTTVKKW